LRSEGSGRVKTEEESSFSYKYINKQIKGSRLVIFEEEDGDGGREKARRSATTRW
jgi:hypothetical protein